MIFSVDIADMFIPRISMAIFDLNVSHHPCHLPRLKAAEASHGDHAVSHDATWMHLIAA
jgi:hypothetical protein